MSREKLKELKAKLAATKKDSERLKESFTDSCATERSLERAIEELEYSLNKDKKSIPNPLKYDKENYYPLNLQLTTYDDEHFDLHKFELIENAKMIDLKVDSFYTAPIKYGIWFIAIFSSFEARQEFLIKHVLYNYYNPVITYYDMSEEMGS